MDAQGFIEQRAHRRCFVTNIDECVHNRQRSNLADHVGTGDDAVAEFCIAFFEVNRFCPQHEVREVDVPFVRRYVGAFC